MSETSGVNEPRTGSDKYIIRDVCNASFTRSSTRVDSLQTFRLSNVYPRYLYNITAKPFYSLTARPSYGIGEGLSPDYVVANINCSYKPSGKSEIDYNKHLTTIFSEGGPSFSTPMGLNERFSGDSAFSNSFTFYSCLLYTSPSPRD